MKMVMMTVFWEQCSITQHEQTCHSLLIDRTNDSGSIWQGMMMMTIAMIMMVKVIRTDDDDDDDEREKVFGLCYGAFIFGRDLVQIEWWLKPTHWPDVKSELWRFSSPR